MTTKTHNVDDTAHAAVRRVWLLVAALVVIAVVATAPLLDVGLDGDDLLIGTALALGVAITERWSLNARIGHVSQRLTLSEVPLLVGLFLVPGIVLVAARVVGALVALRVLRRQEPHKAGFNVAYLWVETIAVVGWFEVVRPESVSDGLRAVLLVVGVAAIVAIIGAAAMTGAISAMERRFSTDHAARTVRDGFTPSLATAAAATIGMILARTDPVLLWAPAVITGVLWLAYRSHVGLLEAQTIQAELSAITHQITGNASVEETIQRLVQAARALMNAPAAAIRILDDDGAPHWHGADGPHEDLDHEVAKRSGAHGRPAACCDNAAPVVAAPIDAIPGAWLAVSFSERHLIARTDAKAAEMLANHASVAITNARRGSLLEARAAEANRLAQQDPLTGLPNRTALMKRVTEALDAGTPFAVLLIDLDNFKEINDALGHTAGDSVLVAIAERCKDTDLDMVFGRLGGDEFLAVVRGDETIAKRSAEGLRARIGRSVELGPYSLEVGSSVGISLHPRHGNTVGELLKQADLAMYGAKSDGSGVQIFGEAAGGRALRQLAISSGFRGALANDEIGVVFQPLVDLATGAPVAVEALARWTDPGLGPVNPEEFVRVAEQAGLTAELTARVLNVSLANLRDWHAAGLELGLSVNLSVRTLMHAGLIRMVAEALQRYGIQPRHLTLEITETSVLTDPQRTLPVLDRLARLGVKLAIDDFGTGYSSLAYLRQMPAHEVKIDKSFIIPMVDDPGAEPLVGGIIRLCHEMGFTVVGEGVENDRVGHLLRELGCDLGQGFGIARPMAAERVGPWVRAQLAEHASVA